MLKYNDYFKSPKVELLKLLQNYQARPYKFELCWKCLVSENLYRSTQLYF